MELEQHYSPIYVAETNTTIYRMPLAAPTGEAVIPNAEDDGYSVYLAEDLTDSQAREKAKHAINHVVNNDHEKADVQVIETAAHASSADPAPAPAAPRKKPALKKNRKRLMRPDEYEKIGIDPRLAGILKLTVIDSPKVSKQEYAKFCDNMEDLKNNKNK